jgi:erythromycin esterase-like protein
MGRYADEVRGLASPLADAGDLDRLIDRIGDARVVMLGEASHGTSEFYRWRAALTRRLIAERGFSFVGVEGDWPDCERVDRSVRGHPGAPEDPRAALFEFERWPTWMWANEEVVDFCRWLRTHNDGLDPAERAGFHGLDVYSLWESLREILMHVREHDPDTLPEVLDAYRCFEPYGEDPQRYAVQVAFVPDSCVQEVTDLLVNMRQRAADRAEEFSVWQNAEVVARAEQYYRAMVFGGPDAWNIRDTHMADTLDRLLKHYGPAAKAVVWAHNTHVGDARGTDMAEAGEVNLGQLGRERHGEDQVVLVGFGTHRGRVIASRSWDAPMEAMPVPPGRPGSVEDVLHTTAPTWALLVFPRTDQPDFLVDWLGHRAVGVVYHPERERTGNYVPTQLGKRYDAFVWLDETTALHPLHTRRVSVLEPETYPVGV